MFRVNFLGFLLLSLLTGCASVPSFKNDSVSSPSKKGGAYYLDDGPGDHPPGDIDAIPDAAPKAKEAPNILSISLPLRFSVMYCLNDFIRRKILDFLLYDR